MVFQDARDSLNPRFTAFQVIADPLRRLRRLRGAELAARVREAAGLAGLPDELLGRFPHRLSGGQKARVGIARAVAREPRLLILDEPTAALDVSVQVVILQLLETLKRRLGMSYLLVSHDLNVVRLLCDRVLVMYLGEIIESGPVDAVFGNPAHPYTKALWQRSRRSISVGSRGCASAANRAAQSIPTPPPGGSMALSQGPEQLRNNDAGPAAIRRRPLGRVPLPRGRHSGRDGDRCVIRNSATYRRNARRSVSPLRSRAQAPRLKSPLARNPAC